LEKKIKYREFTLPNYHGYSIFACEWIPEAKTKAVITLVHGLGEHSGRYQHVADFYTKNGFTVVSFDLFGHGKSAGQRGHLPEGKTFLSSIDDLISYASSQYPHLPVILCGHSLGGELVLWYGIERKLKINGIISTAPFFASYEPVPPLKLFLAKSMNTIFPAFSMKSELNTDALSRDKNIVTKYKADPLVHGMISARLGWFMLEKGYWLLDHANEFSLPLLLMVGGEERLVDRSKIDEFAKRVPNIDYKIWEGLYHELHNEPEKDAVLKYELNWVNKHLK
jgi:alpha-beta hydrolase superfamily lysophospholipase